jgi:hypothetical protein
LCLAAMRSSTTFFAIERIIAAASPAELENCPPWLIAELYQWTDAYERQGRLTAVSNLGETDHSAIAKRLLEILPPKKSLGPSVDLQVCELLHPSGRVHKYFTYYTAASDAPTVLHGLHREYTEAGAFTETEFRHGAAVGRARVFSVTGQEIGRVGTVAPNPSIERTCPGKPGHASHLKR